MKTTLKKIFVSFLVSFVLIFSSCADADIRVTCGEGRAENKFPETEKSFALTVNISSGTFHVDENCRYVKNMKEENKKIISYSEIETAIGDGFKPCSVCAAEYKTTEENNG